jgi:plasmid maintenance system antidote protein VapI
MAGAFDNRHNNLLAVLKNYRSLADAVSHTGVSANYLSQLKGGKHIGHVMARRLESGFGLEPGWLDLDHTREESQPMSEHHITQQALQLPLKSRTRLVKKLVNSLPE